MNDSDQGKVNVICLKWGTAYPPFYVNRLYAGVRRHMKRPFSFICFTNAGPFRGILTQSPNADALAGEWR